MQIETVQTQALPWIYLSYQTSMDSTEIGRVMGEAFQKLGQFVGQNQIAVAGPALSVYRDYTDTGMTVDIGFPIPAAALGKASGEIKAGQTPSGKVLKAVHRGPYDKLRETYDALGKHMKAADIPMPAISWEVYLSDPNTTADADLITEIFMPVE